MRRAGVIEPEDPEESAAGCQRHYERGSKPEALLEERGQTRFRLAGRRLHERREAQRNQSLSEPRDLRLLDGEPVEGSRPPARREGRDRAELPGGRIVAQDRATVHPDEAGHHAHDRGEQLVRVRQPADHLRDPDQRGEDLHLANFLRVGHAVPMRTDAIRRFADGYHPDGCRKSPLAPAHVRGAWPRPARCSASSVSRSRSSGSASHGSSSRSREWRSSSSARSS